MRFIRSLAEVKKACIKANLQLGNIDEKRSQAILTAIEEVLEGKHTEQFPLDVFQTGSGTQFNINMNEVLSNRANEILGCPLGKKSPVHPNDHVNKSQSSNDVIPTAMHLSTLELLDLDLFPALESLRKSLRRKIREFEGKHREHQLPAAEGSYGRDKPRSAHRVRQGFRNSTKSKQKRQER